MKCQEIEQIAGYRSMQSVRRFHMHAEVLVGNRNTGPNPCYLTYPLSDKGIEAGAGLKHELEGNRPRETVIVRVGTEKSKFLR